MRSQPSVPLGFALLMGVALLAGVGAGFTMTPVGSGKSAPPSMTAPPPPSVTALATTTTAPAAPARSVIGPRCLVQSTGERMEGIERPDFIAGVDRVLVGLIATAFGAQPVIGTLSSPQMRIQAKPGTRGVLLLPEEPAAEELAQLILVGTSSDGGPQVIFVRSSDATAAPSPTPYPSVVLVAGPDDNIYSTELAVTSLIRGGSEACRPTPTQNSRGGPS